MTFSIRTILLLTAAFAIALAATLVFPDDVAAFVLIYFNLVITSALLSTAIYDEGWRRAFAVGAIVPFAFGAVFTPICVLNATSYTFQSPGSDMWTLCNLVIAKVELLKTCSVTIWSGAVVSGCTSVFVRFIVRRPTQ